MSTFYRFRSTKALLCEFHELERQEIYFSPPEQLNDPLEGFKDLFWQGDEIVWRNLLRHYLMCLMWGYTLVKIGGDYRDTLSQDTPILSRFLLPVPQGREILNKVCERFFGLYGIDEVPALLAKCQVRFRRDALEFVLRSLHTVAFNAVLHVYRERGMETSPGVASPTAEASPENVVAGMKDVLVKIARGEDGTTPEQLSIMFSVGAHITKQVELLGYLRETSESARAWLALVASFPETYIDRLQHFIFFKWYAACFVVDPNDAAMWGNYGDSHRGVCLQFRATENKDGKPAISLHGVVGSSGIGEASRPVLRDIQVTFEPINYAHELAPIDFFRSIARIPIPDLKADWYVDVDGNRSECGDGVLSQSREWIDRNWSAFLASTTTKLHYWEHEREHRLVLPSIIDLYDTHDSRRLRGDFSDLEGIVFGIKTPLAQKEDIIKIVLAKCEKSGRKDFKFSQAFYAPYSGKMEMRSMDLLRVM
jgi:hypothetical protein